MAIDSTCTGCGKTLRVPDEFAGKQARCPVCQSVYSVPANPTSMPIDSPWQRYDSSTSLEPLQPTLPSIPASVPAPEPTSTFSDPRIGSDIAGTSLNSPASLTARFFARTPTGAEYGPVDAETVLQWEREGRLNDTCMVRDDCGGHWIALSSWKFQFQPKTNPFAGSIPGPTAFGSIPQVGNQSVSYQKPGQGALVLVLGIVSWVLCITFFGAPICSLICVVIGLNDLQRIKRGEASPDNKGLTIIGLIIGGLNLVVCGLMLILIVVFGAIG